MINSILNIDNHYDCRVFAGYKSPQIVDLGQSLLQYDGSSKIYFGIASYEYVFMIKSSVLYPAVLILLGTLCSLLLA